MIVGKKGGHRRGKSERKKSRRCIIQLEEVSRKIPLSSKKKRGTTAGEMLWDSGERRGKLTVPFYLKAIGEEGGKKKGPGMRIAPRVGGNQLKLQSGEEPLGKTQLS